METLKKDYLLSGIKVIDAASFIAGPSAATIMSDYGAEVIKIEPQNGDSLRNLITNGRMPEGPENYCWELTSRNKKSVSLNLKDEKAHNILIDLIKEADVFITNMPFPIRKKLKITSDDIRPHNTKLIYASLTGYGEVGPDADRTAYDSVAWWARSGLMDFVRPSNNSPVAWSTPGMGDHPTGMALYGAIEWPKLTEVLDRADWLQRELFNFDDAFQNADLLRSELSEEFKKRSLDEINQLLRNSGVTYGVLGKTTDHRDDRQFLETKTLVPLTHESFENLLTINSPFTIQDENKIDFSRAPNVGEHTKEVLENMGYSDAELEDLKNGSSIYWPNEI